LIPASEIKLLNFISNIKPCIIGIGKGLLKVLACLARHATKVIKICMQLFIGLVKTLVTLASLVMKMIVRLYTGIEKEVILFFKFFLGVAIETLKTIIVGYFKLAVLIQLYKWLL
jgi:hypothetical protein